MSSCTYEGNCSIALQRGQADLTSARKEGSNISGGENRTGWNRTPRELNKRNGALFSF